MRKNCDLCGKPLRPCPSKRRADGELTYVGFFPCACKKIIRTDYGLVYPNTEEHNILLKSGRYDINDLLEKRNVKSIIFNMALKENEYTGIRDWKLNNINEGSIILTKQGTKFVVCWSITYSMWCLVQCNEGNKPDLQGDWFSLEAYMQPNMEIIGSIYTDSELIK